MRRWRDGRARSRPCPGRRGDALPPRILSLLPRPASFPCPNSAVGAPRFELEPQVAGVRKVASLSHSTPPSACPCGASYETLGTDWALVAEVQGPSGCHLPTGRVRRAPKARDRSRLGDCAPAGRARSRRPTARSPAEWPGFVVSHDMPLPEAHDEIGLSLGRLLPLRLIRRVGDAGEQIVANRRDELRRTRTRVACS